MQSEGSRNRSARAALAIATLSAMTLGAAFGAHNVLAAPHAATTFTVTNTQDSGTGSLRQAILNANANPGADTINFNIPSSGVQRISPLTPLPGISEAVTIDGYTQPGASPNTNPFGQGLNSTLLIELNGDNISSQDGLAIGAPGTVVRGLIINGFDNNGDFQSGIYINTSGVKIEGNYIGTNAAGTAPNANGSGMRLQGGSNTIGGTTPASRNLISGNTRGVFIITSSANRIEGNLIGTTRNGNDDLGNTQHGVQIIGSGNFIGGSAAGAGNVISGNDIDGIVISEDVVAAVNNVIEGNYIGTNAAGTAAVPNAQRGVLVEGLGFGAHNNVIGGTSAGSRNIISGNAGAGIEFSGVPGGGKTPAGGKVLGNYIGTNAAGTGAIPNGTDGVLINNSQGVTVGGTASGSGNVISGNARNGVTLQGHADGNTIQGNLIGTGATGTTDLGNIENGIFIASVHPDHNVIGGTTSAARNIISGNNQHGVHIVGDVVAAHIATRIEGNYIGTNLAGNAAIGNTLAGVNLFEAAGVTVGGTTSGAGNLISGNGQEGVRLASDGASFNSVQGNFIGTNAAGTAAVPNGKSGVTLGSGAQINAIGGTTAAARNLISGNAGAGLIVEENAHSNEIAGNYIGTALNGSTALGNVGVGVVMSSTNATLGGVEAGQSNLIAFNGTNGVQVRTGSGNRILSNSIHSNASLGIDLLPAGVTPNDAGDGDNGPNGLQNYPVLNAVTLSGANTLVTGTLNSKPDATYTVQFFHNPTCHASGSGEGKTLLDTKSVTTDASGNATFNVSLPLAPQSSFVSATATDSAGNTSEFSVCRQATGTGQATATATRTATTPAGSTATSTATTPAGSTATSTAVGGATGTRTASATATAAVSSTPGTGNPSSTPNATATTVPGGCTVSFPDVPQGSTFYSFVRCLACRGIIGGFSDGTFRPSANVTRGQLSKIVANAAGFNESPGEQVFQDVTPGSPFFDYVQRLNRRGVIDGYRCGGAGEPCGAGNLSYFRPNNNATRGQISKIVAIAAGYQDASMTQSFADVPPGSTFHTWIENLTSRQVMSGYPCGGPGEPCGAGNRPYFRSNANATRGQLAKIVSNTFFPNCQTP
ncbi:MAG: S-layer homology domain-containing protein [Chloroflexota bacterium]|nr:S-layer homology domain-containing protein [Chloroflexota bacterium]